MAKTLTYEQKVEALIKGDDAKAIATKNKAKLEMSIKTQLTLKEALKMDLEDTLQSAKQHAENVLLNKGQTIANKAEGDEVVAVFFKAKTAVDNAQEKLDHHNREVEFLKEALELLN